MNNLLHHVAVHVVLCISDHALYHVAAYGAGLLRADVAVVALLKVYVQGIGATPEYTGYKYLVCAIVMSMQNEYLLNNVTTKMYPAIGKRYGVSPASIERSIRTVISAIWYDGDPELLRKLMGRSYPVQPGNAKFIGVVSRRLSFYCRRNAETSKISGQANI